MDRRTFVHRASITAAGFGVLRNAQACAPPASVGPAPVLESFASIRDRFFVYHLERNPVTSTYLGGDGYSPLLTDTNSRLRDYRTASLDVEINFYRALRDVIGRIPVATLSPRDKADHGLMDAQLEFLIHQMQDLRYHQRAVDTYVSEPFRGVDWQIQQMPELPGGLLGGESEWQQVVARTLVIPGYLEAAKANLLAGKRDGIIPDRRMVQRDGINGSTANADWFRNTLPTTARRFIGSRPFASTMLARIGSSGIAAATAWEQFAAFLSQTYDVNEAVDRFAAGEREYEWRVHDVLRDPRTAAELYAYGAAQVELYTGKMQKVAREFAREARLNVSGSDSVPSLLIRGVMDFLSKDSPASDDQLFRWYREAGARAVAYGRENKLFDVPPDYRLDVVPTPPVLQSTIEAAYYPAPPFKKTGVGRFYLTPTGNDPAALKQNNFASVADTAVHEGFPGHDWHFRYMTQHGTGISNIRWLTPGAVEDSSSMWSDSMATEGWGLYAEELMSEPVPNHPYGFYSAGEYLYELQGQLLRAVRIRVDVGLHTGRMTFSQAEDYFATNVLFAPNARARAASDPAARAAMDSAGRAIYRYSKWPTQAITYNLGKNAIIELREGCKARMGSAWTPREFHERFMREGQIAVAFIRDGFLEECSPRGEKLVPNSSGVTND